MKRQELEKVIDHFVNTIPQKTLREMVYEQYVSTLLEDEELLIDSLESDAKKSIKELLDESTGGGNE